MLVCFDWRGVTNEKKDKDAFASLFQELRANGHDIGVMTNDELDDQEKEYLQSLDPNIKFFEEIQKRMKVGYEQSLLFKYNVNAEQMKQMVLVDDQRENVQMAANYFHAAILHRTVPYTRDELATLGLL